MIRFKSIPPKETAGRVPNMGALEQRGGSVRKITVAAQPTGSGSVLFHTWRDCALAFS
jgi:hypothetical protein